MVDRKPRSNKGKKRGPYKARGGPSKPRTTNGVITKCISAFINKTLKLTKTGTPFLKTKAGNRYSCKSQLKKKGMSMSNYKKPSVQKPTTPPYKFKKGTVRNGYQVKYVTTALGRKKVWRKI